MIEVKKETFPDVVSCLSCSDRRKTVIRLSIGPKHYRTVTEICLNCAESVLKQLIHELGYNVEVL